MENQDSVSQGKKKYFASFSRRRKVIIALVAVLLLTGIAGRWFTFGTARGGYRGLPFMGSGNVALAAKDFEPRGIVFVDVAAAAWDGYRTTYDALMKEAAQKGADAIINVNISSTGVFFNRKWSGSALAVNYLDTLPEGYQAFQSADPALLMRGGWFGRNRY